MKRTCYKENVLTEALEFLTLVAALLDILMMSSAIQSNKDSLNYCPEKKRLQI